MGALIVYGCNVSLFVNLNVIGLYLFRQQLGDSNMVSMIIPKGGVIQLSQTPEQQMISS